MAKKDKKEEIPSWIKDLYKEDLDRVVRGERPMYFRGMDDSPLRNVSPEFDILSGGAAVKGMNGIRGALSPLNNGMGNYNFSIRGINKKIGELVDEAGLYLPEKLRPVYRTVVDAMSSSKDKGLGYITQPLANALYPADERRNRRLDGEHPVGYVDAIDGIWPRDKYGLWGEKIKDKQDGGPIKVDGEFYKRPRYLIDSVVESIEKAMKSPAKKLDKSNGMVDSDGDKWYKAINPGIETDVKSALYHGPGILGRMMFNIERDDYATDHEEALWKAYATGDISGLPKSDVRFEGDDDNAQYVGLPQEQARMIQALADTMYTKLNKEKVKGKSYKNIYEDEGMRRAASEDNDVAEIIINSPNEWVVVNESHSPVRLRKKKEGSDRKYKYTGLGGLKNFSVRWHPDTRVLDVKDDYDFKRFGVEGVIPERDTPLRIRDRIVLPKEGSYAYRNPGYFESIGYDDKFDKGGAVENNLPYGAGKYVVDPRRSDDSKMTVYDEIWDYLTDKKGIPQTQAIGILANIAAESGGDTEALGAAGDFGIQQWLGPRKKELQRRYGKKPTLTQQLDYLVDEYQGRVPGLGWNYMNQGKFFDKDAQGNVYNYYMYSKADFDNATNYKDATVAWNQGYGRPLGSTLRNEKRLEFADMFSNRYGVPENEPMRYEFGQRDSGTGDGGQQPVPETVAPADPSLASRPSVDSWWEKEGQDLLYKMLAQSGANKKAIEDIANNIKNDPQSEAQIAEAERMRREQAKRQLVLNMIPGLSLNIKGVSRNNS